MSLSQYDPGQELSSIDFSAVIGGPLSAIVEAQSKAALSTVDFIKSVGFSPDTEDETTGEITPGKPIYVSFKYPKMVQPYQPAVNGNLDAVTIDNAGTGYQAGEVLAVGTTGLSVTVATVNGSGAIQSINYNASGSGYTDGATYPGIGGTGTNAEFKIEASDVEAQAAIFEEMKLEVPILTMMPIPFIRVEEGEIDFHAKITSMEYSRVGTDFKLGTTLTIDNNNTNQNILVGTGFINYNKNVNTINLKTNFSYQRSTHSGHKIDKTYHLGVKVKVGQEEMPEGMERLLGILEDTIVSQPVE